MNRIHLAVRLILGAILVLGLMVFAHLAGAASITVPKGSTCRHDADLTTITITCAAVVTPTTPTNPNPPPPPPPPPPPTGACPSTTGVQMGSFDAEVQRTFRLRPGQSASMSFRLRSHMIGINAPKLSTIETTQTPLTADQEVRVSACPGDFSSPCGGFVKFNGGSVSVVIGQSPAACQFPAGTYYLNVRQVRRTGAPSCALASGCDVNLGIQNYRP